MNKIKRRFIWIDSDKHGNAGWVPMWVAKSADFDASTEARLIMHDMVEHALVDTGTFRDEIMAFGRIMAIRHETGAFTYWNSANERGRSMGAELCSIWGDADRTTIPEAPRVRHKFGQWATHFFYDVASGFANSHRNHDFFNFALSDNDDSFNDKEVGYTVGRLINWLKLGYLDAKRRYGGDTWLPQWAYSANHFMNSARIPKAEVEGEQLEITLERGGSWSFKRLSAYYNDESLPMRATSRHWLYS